MDLSYRWLQDTQYECWEENFGPWKGPSFRPPLPTHLLYCHLFLPFNQLLILCFPFGHIWLPPESGLITLGHLLRFRNCAVVPIGMVTNSNPFLHHHDNGESSRKLGSTTHTELVKWSFLEEIWNATQRNKGVRGELMDLSGSIISLQNTSLLANKFVQNSNSWSRMVSRLLSDHSDFNLYLYFLFVCASSKWNINPLF